LHAAGQNAPALNVLEQSLRTAPYSAELLGAAAEYARQAGQVERATEYARRRAALAQTD
jgi:Flp pilus assembly protein TadD